jgi:hypothetical protein
MTPETETALTTTVQAHSGISIITDIPVFEHMWRIARIFAASDIVPKQFVGNEPNCFIAVEMSNRMGINPVALMQNMAIVNGRPTLEAKLITALINDSGMLIDNLEYEIEGTEPGWNKAGNKPVDATYRVRAHAVKRSTGERLYGEWISWDMVIGEGWQAKNGSKWQTMPGQMFHYRAASFFSKIYCTNITLGMQTREEMEDITPVAIGTRTGRAATAIEKINAAKVVVTVEDEPETEPCEFCQRTDGTHESACPEFQE